MNLTNDPQRETRIRLLEEFVVSIFNECKKHYGLSKYQKDYPIIIVESEEESILGGEYCFENNLITINYQGFDDSQECTNYYTRLITHEYIHYTQSPTWFKRYYKYHGHDYLSHPYEVEAYARETELLTLN